MRRSWPVVLLLIVITAAVYWRVSGHDFVNYDDNDYVTANPEVQAGLTRHGVAWAFGELHGAKTYWHPLTWLSHMLDCQLFGLRPGPHHLVNVFLHLINAALLFLVLKHMTGAHWRSAVVAGLFALHPLQMDTVAWISERKNLLCGLFWMLAMGAYVRYAERPSWRRYALVFASMALGLMAKPVIVTLPCALLLLDVWPLRRTNFLPESSKQNSSTTAPAFRRASLTWLVLEKLPLLGLSAASALITLMAHEGLSMQEARYGLPFEHRVANALVSYTRYLDKTIWPQGLSVLYLHPGAWPAWQVMAAASILFVITAFTLWQIRTRPYLFVGWFWFLGTLVPMIGLRQVGVQAMADRFAYLPLIGLFIMLVWGVADLGMTWRQGRLVVGAAAGVVLAALSACTVLQLGYWQNSFTLFEHAIEVDPANYVAHANLSVAYTGIGQLAKAREHAEEAIRITPTFVEARLQLGLIAVMEQQPDDARAYYRSALRNRPDALAVLRQIGEYLMQSQRWNDAAMHYALYLEVAPDDLIARGQRAAALCLAQRPVQAAAEYQEMLRRKPDSPDILNNLAWLRATNPQAEARDGAEAIRLAERACDLTQRQQPVYLGTLAAAYAEAGRFGNAIETARLARDLALAKGQAEIAKMNEKLLEFYRASKPYRQEEL
jgi:tetratricopeptide (TPR) repeat protein